MDRNNGSKYILVGIIVFFLSLSLAGLSLSYNKQESIFTSIVLMGLIVGKGLMIYGFFKLPRHDYVSDSGLKKTNDGEYKYSIED